MIRFIIDTALQIHSVNARYIKILHFIQVVNRFIYRPENRFDECLSVLFFAVSDTRLNAEMQG